VNLTNAKAGRQHGITWNAEDIMNMGYPDGIYVAYPTVYPQSKMALKPLLVFHFMPIKLWDDVSHGVFLS
jgi:asparagine N-glycosylation enzyme membrane subunit Stt3